MCTLKVYEWTKCTLESGTLLYNVYAKVYVRVEKVYIRVQSTKCTLVYNVYAKV